MEFKVGDLVKLKSGSPLMTVTVVKSDNTVFCQWVDVKGKPQYGDFPFDAIIKIMPA